MKLNVLLTTLLFGIALVIPLVSHIYLSASAERIIDTESRKYVRDELLTLKSVIENLARNDAIDLAADAMIRSSSDEDDYSIILSENADVLLSSTAHPSVGLREARTLIATQEAQPPLSYHNESLYIEATPICIVPPSCSWLVVVKDTTQQLKAASILAARESAIILLLAMTSVGVLLVIIHIKFSVRIDYLTHMLTRWKLGDREARIEITGKDELAVIGTAVDQLVQQFDRDHELLIASQQLNTAIIDSSNYAIITTDRSGLILSLNHAGERLLGYAASELVKVCTPLVIQDRSHFSEHGSMVANFHLSYNVKKMTFSPTESVTFDDETVFVRKDGKHVPVSISVSPLFDQDDFHTGFLCIAQDIGEQVATQQNLRISASVFSHSNQGIIIVGQDKSVIDVNDRFLELLDTPREEVIGEAANKWLSSRHSLAFFNQCWNRTIRTGEWSGEVWLQPTSRDEFPTEQVMHSINSPDGNHEYVIILSQDITAKKQAEHRLEQMAYLDSLTNLPNRFLFRDRLEQAIETARRSKYFVALMFIDLDRFKIVNDNYGHEVGDELLVEVARRLSQQVRPMDTISRLGGDEFTVILNKLNPKSAYADAAAMAERLYLSLEAPCKIGDRDLYVNASIGIAMFPDNGTTFSELSRNADTAMYQAKEIEESSYKFFNNEMLDNNLRRLKIETELRRDVKLKRLEIRFQPIIDIENMCIKGFEALCRWQHSEFGQVNPSEFISIAEDIGVINELGKWVIEQSLAQLKVWTEISDTPVYLSVNTSPQQFKANDLAGVIGEQIEELQLDPGSIEIEITESVVMDHDPSTTRQIRTLRNLGLRIAIDDFGTGYSSLSYLRRFPVDTLKIDRSFVKNAPKDETDLTIIRAIHSISKRMKTRVVAEGVESHEQMKILADEGIQLIQGYIFSEPLTAEEAVQYLKDQDKLAAINFQS